MDKKKLYLIIGGVVLAIALVIALVVGLGGNKTETPNGETTTPTVNESVGDNGGETTTPEGGETTTPDGNETTNPGGETTTPNDGETTKPDGNETEPEVTIPEIDVEDFDEIKNLLNEHLMGDGEIKYSESVQCGDYAVVVQLFPDGEHVLTKTYENGDYEQYTYAPSGEIVLQTMYDVDCTLLYMKEVRDDANFMLDNREKIGYYEEYDSNGNVIAKATFKTVDGKYYVLTKEIVGSCKVTVSYHDSAPTIMSEMVYDGPNYYHCKWNSSGNKNENLTYYEYRGADGTSSKQSGTIDLFMLPSPPTNLTFDLTGLR